MLARAVCDTCGQACISNGGGTGYGIDRDTGDHICYRCCGIADAESMARDGQVCLYLTNNEVTNWPGSLRFSVWGPTRGSHNIASSRYDVWFIGPQGEAWWGVQYGERTQLCHCKRLKAGGEAARDVKRWALRTGQLQVKDRFVLGQSALEATI